MAYLDTSILGAYYCPEPLSAVVTAAMQALSQAVINPLVEVEFCSLLSLKVRRATLTPAAANVILAQFRDNLAQGLYQVVPLGPSELELAGNWLARFDTPLRTLDAVHLATALAHKQEMLTADMALARAARHIGVACRLLP